ncbi:unnamed protein product [Oppiella nova]|uniref:Uncharacterized protein n=1 Tax=Oppiella nova TaxID=334625 RepID=A0A7R9QYA9_9ACAR|nr:unnamed protein product [Oppiella nova]CAG2180057.1 unnamed protein product [Oppiella nova]
MNGSVGVNDMSADNETIDETLNPRDHSMHSQCGDECIELLINYRKCLLQFKTQCKCGDNQFNRFVVSLLEKEWKSLHTKRTTDETPARPSQAPSHSTPNRSSVGPQDIEDYLHISLQTNSHDISVNDGYESNSHIDRKPVVKDSLYYNSAISEDYVLLPLMSSHSEADNTDETVDEVVDPNVTRSARSQQTDGQPFKTISQRIQSVLTVNAFPEEIIE